MKVFLDIGAHTGETLAVVAREDRWGFVGNVHAFEPAPSACRTIENAFGSTVNLHPFGLWDRDATLPLHNAGAIGASMSQDKEATGETVDCEFRDVAAWFRDNLRPDDEIWAKINVEGAEAEVIGRLHEAGLLHYLDHLMIHFDVRKVPSKRHLETQIRGQLEDAGVNYIDASEVMFNLGVVRGTRHWLAWAQSDPKWRDLRYKTLGRVESAARNALYPLKNALRRA